MRSKMQRKPCAPQASLCVWEAALTRSTVIPHFLQDSERVWANCHFLVTLSKILLTQDAHTSILKIVERTLAEPRSIFSTEGIQQMGGESLAFADVTSFVLFSFRRKQRLTSQ
jgi:hypothetical protein